MGNSKQLGEVIIDGWCTLHEVHWEWDRNAKDSNKLALYWKIYYLLLIFDKSIKITLTLIVRLLVWCNYFGVLEDNDLFPIVQYL